MREKWNFNQTLHAWAILHASVNAANLKLRSSRAKQSVTSEQQREWQSQRSLLAVSSPAQRCKCFRWARDFTHACVCFVFSHECFPCFQTRKVIKGHLWRFLRYKRPSVSQEQRFQLAYMAFTMFSKWIAIHWVVRAYFGLN